MKKVHFYVIGVFVFFLLFAFSHSVHAADPQFLVTWKAKTNIPSWYKGKALPIEKSDVVVTFSLLEQNGAAAGKIIDLSNAEIRWYLKGDLVSKGRGMTSLTIYNKDLSGNDIDLKIAASYRDVAGGERFVETYQIIPIVSPEAVIEYRHLQPFFARGSTVSLKGFPFFFTNSLLRSEWNIDGVQKVTDTYDIKIENAPEALRNIKFSIQNAQRTMERAQSLLSIQAN